MRVTLAIAIGWIGLSSGWARAALDDRNESPYLVSEGEGLTLEESFHDVSVSGVVAHVRLSQIYVNESADTLDAQYVFPLSTRAAVNRMRMTVGTRTTEADIQEREAAKRTYEAAVQAGHTASLLEQERPNVFTMSVGAVNAGEAVQIELEYVELLVPTDGAYALAIPGVVAPHYGGDFDCTAPPRLGSWDVAVRLEGGVPVQWVQSATHALVHSSLDAEVVDVSLRDAEPEPGRDFVMRYALADDAVEAGVLRYVHPDGEQFFLAMIEPPARVEPDVIVPREYVFIVDVSGSMEGRPLETARTLMGQLLGDLRPEERFNVVTFAGGSDVLAPQSVAPSKDTIAEALGMLRESGGGTEIVDALKRALALPTVGASHSRVIVIITDGMVYLADDAIDAVRRGLGGANVFAFGVGGGMDRHVIEGLAKAGRGEPFFVDDDGDASDDVAAFRDYVEAPVLTHVSLVADGVELYDVEPSSVPDVFASRPIVVTGKYRGAGLGHLTLAGTTARGPWQRSVALGVGATPSNAALRVLWARERIARLSDFAGLAATMNRDEVTALGLRYHLMTAYTSFVGVDGPTREAQAEQLTTVNAAAFATSGSALLSMVGEIDSAGGGGMGFAGGAPLLAPPPPRPSLTLQIKRFVMSNRSGERSYELAVRRRLGALRACAQGALGEITKPLQYTVRFDVDADGAVANLSTSAQDAHGSCVRRFLERVRYPKGLKASVMMELVVRPP